jgi:predicted nucleic acid-binding protein
MARYVIDASVALNWFLDEGQYGTADAVMSRAADDPESFAVLHRKHPKAWEVCKEGIIPFMQSGILRYPMTEGIAERAAKLIVLGISGYDAIYAALAQELDALWLTFDAKAHGLLQKERISVDLSSALPPDS